MWTLRRAGNTMAQNLPVADGSHDHVLKRVDYIKHRNTHARFGGLGWGYPQPRPWKTHQSAGGKKIMGFRARTSQFIVMCEIEDVRN